MLAPKTDEKSMSFARSDFLSKCGFSTARIKILRVWGSKFAFKNEAKSIKNNVEMGGRFGIEFSSILVGLEGQVGKPNRAKREPKRYQNRTKIEGKYDVEKRCFSRPSWSLLGTILGHFGGHLGVRKIIFVLEKPIREQNPRFS